MRKLLAVLAVSTVLALSCATTSGGRKTGSGEEAADAKIPTSVGAVTDAVIEIEKALGTEQIKAIQERYQKPYQLDPKDPFKRFLWAYSLDDRNDAWQELTKITKLNDRFYWAYLGMGIILDGWKVDDQAELNFNRALELGSKIAIGYGRFGRMYLRKREPEKALPLLRNAVEKDPARLAYQLDLARALDIAGSLPEALEAYQKVVKKDPSSFGALAEMADLLKRKGDKAEAVETYAKAAALDAAAYAVRFERALLLKELKRDEEALSAFQDACQAKPDSLECWQALAHQAAALGKKEVVVGGFEHVILIDKFNPEAHKFLAPVYLDTGEIEKALPSFQVMLHNDKDNLDALIGLATIFERGEEFSKAIEYNARVLALKPDQPAALAAQARFFAQFSILPERIDGKSPDQVFAKNRAQIAAVYKERLKENPHLKGDLVVKVKVTNDGAVEDATVSQNTVGDQVLELCAIWNLKRSKFPSGLGASYDFELSLKPGG